MHFVVIPIFLFLFTGTSAQWEYTRRSNATDGQPCLTDCKNNKCTVYWDGRTKQCWTNNRPAAKFFTAQVNDKNSKYCLSNCGFFSYPYQWCVTTNEKGWDFCNAEHWDYSIYKKPCIGECRKGASDYYWCTVDNYGNWQFCAPGREEESDYYGIDERYNDETVPQNNGNNEVLNSP